MMIETMKRTMRRALIAGLALASLPGAVKAQEGRQDIQNVLLTFHLVQADGFTDDDPEISDVVTELRKYFNFEGYRLLSTSLFNVGMYLSDDDIEPLRGSGTQRIVVENSEMTLEVSASLRAARGSGTVRGTVTLTDITSYVNQSRPMNPSHLLRITVNMRDGQRVVLGSAPRTADEPVLILVVTARIDPEF